MEDDQTMILLDFQMQTNNLVMANQLDIVVVDKRQKKAVVMGRINPKQQRHLEEGTREAQ